MKRGGLKGRLIQSTSRRILTDTIKPTLKDRRKLDPLSSTRYSYSEQLSINLVTCILITTQALAAVQLGIDAARVFMDSGS